MVSNGENGIVVVDYMGGSSDGDAFPWLGGDGERLEKAAIH